MDYNLFQQHWDSCDFVLAGNIIGGYATAINPSKKVLASIDFKPELADVGKKLDLKSRKTPDDFDYKALNHRKAAAGEFNAHTLMKEKGFTPLGKTDGVYKPGVNGIDGVYRHPNPPPDFVITEAKYNKARLGKTKDGKQMSNDWVTESRLKKAGMSKKERRKVLKGLKKRDGIVEKYLIRNKPDGTLLVKRLDEEAHVVGKVSDFDF
ncbi:hypothetical protein ACQKP8_24625 [Photobacterium alginatilyticum]|uniref:hypothetical protein n=1 Tax=Photobacterium alginatilyticum TaxID=1775171 RepID=UPI004069129B